MMNNEIRKLPNGDFEVLPNQERALANLRQQRYAAVQRGEFGVVTSLDEEITHLLKVTQQVR